MQLGHVLCNTSSAEPNVCWRGDKFIHSVPIYCPMPLLEQDVDLYSTPPSSKRNHFKLLKILSCAFVSEGGEHDPIFQEPRIQLSGKENKFDLSVRLHLLQQFSWVWSKPHLLPSFHPCFALWHFNNQHNRESGIGKTLLHFGSRLSKLRYTSPNILFKYLHNGSTYPYIEGFTLLCYSSPKNVNHQF